MGDQPRPKVSQRSHRIPAYKNPLMLGSVVGSFIPR